MGFIKDLYFSVSEGFVDKYLHSRWRQLVNILLLATRNIVVSILNITYMFAPQYLQLDNGGHVT